MPWLQWHIWVRYLSARTSQCFDVYQIFPRSPAPSKHTPSTNCVWDLPLTTGGPQRRRQKTSGPIWNRRLIWWLYLHIFSMFNSLAPGRYGCILKWVISKSISCEITLVWMLQDLTNDYRKISNIRRTKSQNLNVSQLVLQLSLLNPMKPGVKSRMKM